MTERQFQAWQEWINEEWNTPDRSDHYQMQSAMESCRGRLKNPAQVKLEDFRLKFQFKKREMTTYLSPEDKARANSELSKGFWLGMMTLPVDGLPDELKHPSQLDHKEIEQDIHSIEKYK
jgi:hypothetical protein